MCKVQTDEGKSMLSWANGQRDMLGQSRRQGSTAAREIRLSKRSTRGESEAIHSGHSRSGVASLASRGMTSLSWDVACDLPQID